MTTAWDSRFHGVGLSVPKLGTPGSKAWDSQFHGLGLPVPKPGTLSSKAWDFKPKCLYNLMQRKKEDAGRTDTLFTYRKFVG